MGQDGPKIAQDSPKTGQDSPKTGQDGPRWPRVRTKVRSDRPSPPSERDLLTHKAPNTPQDSSRQLQDRPRRLLRPLEGPGFQVAQGNLKMASKMSPPDGPRRPQDGPDMAGDCPKIAPRQAQDRPRRPLRPLEGALISSCPGQLENGVQNEPQDVPRRPQDSPRTGQDGPKIGRQAGRQATRVAWKNG
jgi:hypothetical protein